MRNLNAQNKLPARITHPRNNKDKLFNHLVNLFEKKKVGPGSTHVFPPYMIVCGTLMALEARSGCIPTVFQEFQGYNVPERAKHRKHSATNLCYDSSNKHVVSLNLYYI